MSVNTGMTHLVIGDTQVKPGVPTAHLGWIGQYIVDQFAGRPLRVIHVGDHADMPSLSSYDKGKKAMEGRRYKADIVAANAGWDLLNEPLRRYNKGRRHRWQPDLHITLGNHEDRISRACELDAQLDGMLSLDDLNFAKWGWTVHPYLKPVILDGVHYAHFFYNPNTGRPYSGENLYTRLKTIGHSFTMGHQQTFAWARRPVGQGSHCGLVLGTSYLHDEGYLGPQGNNYWRGVTVCHQVENGSYDLMAVSFEFLCRKYEGMMLADFLKRAT